MALEPRLDPGDPCEQRPDARAAFTAGIECADKRIAVLEPDLARPPKSGPGSTIEVHAESNSAECLDLVQHLRFDDS